MVARTPAEIPPHGWWQVVRRVWSQAQDDQVALLSAGVALYSFLALVPAALWVLRLNGLVRHHAFGFGFAVAVVLAVGSAAGGVDALVSALNVAYDVEETRGFVRRRLLALALTVGAILFVGVALALVIGAPSVLDDVGPGPARWSLEGLRWLLLLITMATMLAVLYRVAPDRADPRFSWVSLGAGIATVGWLLGSLALSFYVRHVGSFHESYGAYGGVVALLLWLWLTTFLVLLGAEINAETERQAGAGVRGRGPGW